MIYILILSKLIMIRRNKVVFIRQRGISKIFHSLAVAGCIVKIMLNLTDVARLNFFEVAGRFHLERRNVTSNIYYCLYIYNNYKLYVCIITS